MCVNSVILLQVQCPDTPPSLRGLNTKAPLSPSIRHSRHKAGFLDNFTLNWKDKMYTFHILQQHPNENSFCHI